MNRMLQTCGDVVLQRWAALGLAALGWADGLRWDGCIGMGGAALGDGCIGMGVSGMGGAGMGCVGQVRRVICGGLALRAGTGAGIWGRNGAMIGR